MLIHDEGINNILLNVAIPNVTETQVFLNSTQPLCLPSNSKLIFHQFKQQIMCSLLFLLLQCLAIHANAQSATFTCPNSNDDDCNCDAELSDGTCTLNCLDKDSCNRDSTLSLGITAFGTVNCVEESSCAEADIDGSETTVLLSVFCADGTNPKQDQCKESNIICPGNAPITSCIVACYDKSSCDSSIINATLGTSNSTLSVFCGSPFTDSGEDACKSAEIHCGKSWCGINCNKKSSCGDVIIDGESAYQVDVKCDDEDSCKGNTQIICPADGAPCNIQCNNPTACEGLEVINDDNCVCTGVGCDEICN